MTTYSAVFCGIRRRRIVQKLLAPREAANILGISYPTLKQWIYHGKNQIAEKRPADITACRRARSTGCFRKKLERGDVENAAGENLRKISGRKPVDRARGGDQIQRSAGAGHAGDRREQHITSIITGGCGQGAAAEARGAGLRPLIKATEVMILRV